MAIERLDRFLTSLVPMKVLFFLVVSSLLLPATNACSTFLINKNGHLIFGRNYDWITGLAHVNTNLRGLYKTSFSVNGGKTISWTSAFGSITFNQYGKEFPTGGMNEKGLVVELMWLSETSYPKADERAGINVLQWIQYQLDNSSTVQDVLNSDNLVRISDNVPIHYLIADANGESATIEWIAGKRVVHSGNSLILPVLTNSTYEASLKNRNKNSDNSIERFSTACSMVEAFQKNNSKQEPTAYAFTMLDKVAQPGYTKWSIVYDLVKRTISFKTNIRARVSTISFDQFKFDCAAPSMFADINRTFQPSAVKDFRPFDNKSNVKSVNQAFEATRRHIDIPRGEQELIAIYPATIICNKDEEKKNRKNKSSALIF